VEVLVVVLLTQVAQAAVVVLAVIVLLQGLLFLLVLPSQLLWAQEAQFQHLRVMGIMAVVVCFLVLHLMAVVAGAAR
jgi:cytochrome c-type biogenesis protein CcmE